MAELFIDRESLAELRDLFKRLYPESLVRAFGSRTDGSAHSGSDLDLAIVDYGRKEMDTPALKDALYDSSIPFLIDIFEFDKLPDSFQNEIRRHYVVLYDGRP